MLATGDNIPGDYTIIERTSTRLVFECEEHSSEGMRAMRLMFLGIFLPVIMIIEVVVSIFMSYRLAFWALLIITAVLLLIYIACAAIYRDKITLIRTVLNRYSDTWQVTHSKKGSGTTFFESQNFKLGDLLLLEQGKGSELEGISTWLLRFLFKDYHLLFVRQPFPVAPIVLYKNKESGPVQCLKAIIDPFVAFKDVEEGDPVDRDDDVDYDVNQDEAVDQDGVKR